ncbi:disulfide bond formation protein DsbB [Rheinheimera sp.]|uniref:disulfide bond formation protein DsbB n=1 Tax=Rheinheimera sp. TaxID=1869214 RepID=UPI003AF440AB
MLVILTKWSKQRWAWGLLAFSALVLLLAALYFQYQMNLEPCMLCVYARAALTGVMLAGVIGMTAPKSGTVRGIAWLLLAAAVSWGLFNSHDHVQVEQLVQSGGLYTCSLFPEFPLGLPLDRWFPDVFNPTGMCGEIGWSFLGLSMPEWTRIIFVIYSLFTLCLLFSQFKKVKYNPYD